MHTKLSHIDLLEQYQFITFRTQDSIDNYVVNIQKNPKFTEKVKQYKIDNYLDNSLNGAYLYGDCISILKDVILQKDTIYYEVEAFCIMPNHLHILLKQLVGIDKIMKYIKGKSAKELNVKLQKTGKFWLSGYFDKGIRDINHFNVVYEYILNNPLKASLRDSDKRVYSKYD